MTQSRPTICHVLHGLRVGGAEVLAARLARQLPCFRWLFYCIDELGTLGEELRGDGFDVTVSDRRPGIDWRCPWRLAEFLRRERVDLIHAHQYTPFFYSLAARLLAPRPPILFTEHGRWFPDYPRPRRIVANRLLLQRRDRVIGVGESVRQALIHNEGLPAVRVGVIHNGIDVSAFANGVNERWQVRREIGVGAGDLVILQVARLDALKDHATALKAIDRVRQQRPDIRLVLVGEGPERERIDALITRLDLSAHVRLLGLRQDVAHLLPAADIFLLSSKSEGIPLTVIEAMAAGLPVVATRVGGLAEVVDDGVTGLLAPAGDAVGLAEHLQRLAGDATLRREMGHRGRLRARARFAETDMHARYLRLYEEMLYV